MRRLAFLIALVASPFAAAAQAPPLTVKSVMRGPDLVGTTPFNVQFGADGRYVYFRWRRPETDTLDADYRVTVAAPQRIERLPRNAIDTIPLTNGAWSPDRRRQVVVLKGDLWLLEQTGTRRRLTQTPGAETAPAWSADGKTIYFTRDNNAWALDVTGGALAQLTDIRRGPAPRSPAEPVGQKKALRDDQRDLFDFIRRQLADERLRFSATGQHALVRITSTNYEDAWLVVVDLPSLAQGEVAHLHDDAWLDGPLSGVSGWVPGAETVYYGDEKTGFAHLYAVGAAGGAPRALTSGNWEVQEVDLAPDGRTVYLHTNEGDFGQVHFYALDLASGGGAARS